ncbi:hypothetical protein ACVBE9_03740 [Eionea flava]
MAQTQTKTRFSNAVDASTYTILPNKNCSLSEHYSIPTSHTSDVHATVNMSANMDKRYSQQQPLADGETAMPYAPTVELPNGNTAIPQHYLHYHHTIDSIQSIIHDIHSLDLTPIFADEDERGCYIQVGIIGEENYDRSGGELPKKIVYGRKWRIEPTTPTSEIIQTAFLAVKKVWEHEAREFLTVKETNSNKTSALFSSHHDLPLMAHNADLIDQEIHHDNSDDIHAFLSRVTFKNCTFVIDDILARPRNIIVDIRLQPPENQHDITLNNAKDGAVRFYTFQASLVLDSLSPGALLYALMDALIAHSNRYIEEHFAYQGFTRFSRQNNPLSIAALSIASRPYSEHMQDNTFASTFEEMNYETDACRVPCMGSGKLADKNRQLIEQIEGLTGHLPTELLQAPSK